MTMAKKPEDFGPVIARQDTLHVDLPGVRAAKSFRAQDERRCCARCGKRTEEIVKVDRQPLCVDCADNFLDSFGEDC